MARIRSVKLGFFRNEHLAVFSFAHRLLFEGLWVIADREGRLEDRPKRIHADLFPFDAALDVDEMLNDLAAGDDPFIVRYEVDGRHYIGIVNFLKHQRPNHREPASDIPPPGQARAKHDTAQERPRGRVKGKGMEIGEGERETAHAPIAPPDPTLLVDLWNSTTTKPIPQCRELTPSRRKHASARLADAALSVWATVITRIEASSFCRGENDRGWVATFDWLLKPDTRVKVTEGKYDNRPGKARAPATQPEAVHAMDWAQECQAMHGGTCNGRYQHSLMRDASMREPVL